MKKAALIIAWLFAAPSLAAEADAAPEAKTIDPAKMAQVLTVGEHDLVDGSHEAPNTIIEYSSLSCSHCAHFHNDVLPAIQKQFIDTGKLRFINRDFPLNAPALKAAILTQCAPEGKEAKFYEVLFKLQDKWAYTPSYESALKKIAAVGGVDNDAFDACMKNEAIEERLLLQRQEAGENLDIQGTPSFFLNGEPFTAPLEAEAFTKALGEALAK